MSTKMHKILLLMVLIVTLLTSCTRVTTEKIMSIKTPTLTQTSVPETEPVSAMTIAKTLVSNSNYLRDCRIINPLKYEGQVPYENILPGKTKETELESLIGDPNKVSTIKGVSNLVYGDVGLLVENGVVTYIVVPINDKSELTLEQVILKYGCPDIIFAINTTEDQLGYTVTRFIYHTIGIEFSFMDYPTGLTSVPTDISYFPTMDLQEYLKENGWNPGTSITSGRPVEWSDAVK